MHSCPFCHSEFERFNPFGHTTPILREVQIVGGGGRVNALCPRCGSLDRERLLYLFLQKHAALALAPVLELAPRWMLHIAPAPRLRRVLSVAQSIEYVPADLHPGPNDVALDVTNIQYSDGFFDAIICNHVLEHIIDDGKAMRELRRVLAWDGWAILQVPYSATIAETIEDPAIVDANERYRAFGQQDHVRIYALADYVLRLEEAGFDVALIDMPKKLGQEEAERYGLNPLEMIVFCTRRAEC